MHLSFLNDSDLVADLVLGKLLTDVPIQLLIQSLVDATVLSLWTIVEVLLVLQVTCIIVVQVAYVHMVYHLPLLIIIVNHLRPLSFSVLDINVFLPVLLSAESG